VYFCASLEGTGYLYEYPNAGDVDFGYFDIPTGVL